MRILLPSLLLIFAFQVSFGQKHQFDDDNWLGAMGYSPEMHLLHIYPNKFYTKEDVDIAKEKFSLIKNANSSDEWEGYYSRWGELSQYGLIWNAASGFIQYNIYTCEVSLRALGYGSIINSADSLLLQYQKQFPLFYISSKRKNVKTQNTLVKVKIGERHFLVPENRIKEFCEYVVGRSQYYDEDIDYWSKVEDRQKKSVKGLIVLPEKYKHLSLPFVDAKITKIGKTKIKFSKDKEDNIETGEFYRYLTINAGKDQNLKKGMSLYISELDEEATVETVYLKSSIVKVSRDFYETKVERCLGDEHNQIPCPEIKVGMLVTTKSPFE